MNREIEFRGRTIPYKDDDFEYEGEWVYGYYHEDHNGKGYIIQADRSGRLYPGVNVIPSTIGQFTGLTDSKGNKVFEGDIESSGGVVKLGIYEMFSDRSGFPTWIAERKNGASFVLVCDNEFKIRETIVGTIHDTHLTKQS